LLQLDHADHGFPSDQSVEDPLMTFDGLAEPPRPDDVGEASALTVAPVSSDSAATQQQQQQPPPPPPAAAPFKRVPFTPMDKETTLRNLEKWVQRSETRKRKRDATAAGQRIASGEWAALLQLDDFGEASDLTVADRARGFCGDEAAAGCSHQRRLIYPHGQ
jgi:hypothetical protein